MPGRSRIVSHGNPLHLAALAHERPATIAGHPVPGHLGARWRLPCHRPDRVTPDDGDPPDLVTDSILLLVLAGVAVAKHRVELDIRPLSPASRDRYVLRWRDAHARFVDAPVRALAEADSLVGQVLRERGYPTGDVDEQVALVAADHGDRADDYRRAFAIHRGVEGEGSTDDLRDAFLRYRAVFEALVAPRPSGDAPPAADGERANPPSRDGAPYDGAEAEHRRRRGRRDHGGAGHRA